MNYHRNYLGRDRRPFQAALSSNHRGLLIHETLHMNLQNQLEQSKNLGDPTDPARSRDKIVLFDDSAVVVLLDNLE